MDSIMMIPDERHQRRTPPRRVKNYYNTSRATRTSNTIASETTTTTNNASSQPIPVLSQQGCMSPSQWGSSCSSVSASVMPASFLKQMYDEDTWRMYHRIEQARMNNVWNSVAQEQYGSSHPICDDNDAAAMSMMMTKTTTTKTTETKQKNSSRIPSLMECLGKASMSEVVGSVMWENRQRINTNNNNINEEVLQHDDEDGEKDHFTLDDEMIFDLDL